MYQLPENVRTLLKAELSSAQLLADSRMINSNEGRQLVTRLIRVLEILTEGRPMTNQVTGHNP